MKVQVFERAAAIGLTVGCLFFLTRALAVEAQKASPAGYSFDRTISREVLERYLSRRDMVEAAFRSRWVRAGPP